MNVEELKNCDLEEIEGILNLQNEKIVGSISFGLTVYNGDICFVQYCSDMEFENLGMSKKDLAIMNWVDGSYDEETDGFKSECEAFCGENEIYNQGIFNKLGNEIFNKYVSPKYSSPNCFSGYLDPVGCFWLLLEINRYN